MPYQRHDKDGNPVTAIASYVRHDKDNNPVAVKKYQRHDKDNDALGPRSEYQRRDSSNTLDSPQPESRTFVDAFGNTYKDYSADYEARDVDGNLLDDFESVFNRSKLDLDFAGNKSLIDAVSGNYLIDHVRDTAPNSSTYVDAAGLIKRSVTNLVINSEDFNAWGQHQGSTSVTVNTANGLDGTLSADTLNFPAANDRVDNLTTIEGGKVYTFSVYLAGSGSITISLASLGGTYIVNSNTVNLTDTLTRHEVTLTTNSNNTGVFPIIGRYLGTGNTATSVTAWGAQLEEASTAGEYVKTTATKSSAPRFDHDPATGESLGLLVEESRTNIAPYSEDFTDASYTVGTRITVTADALAAPNGTVTADKLVATSNDDQKYVNTLLDVTSGLSYTFGMFAKKGEYEVLQLHFANSNFSGSLAYANFNLNTGSIISSTDCTPTIQDIGDGWYRCSVITPAATSTGSNAFRFSVYPSGNPGRLSSYTGDGTSGIYIWGAQVEAGSFPTSYIPTDGAAVTRGADSTSITGTNFSGFYNQIASTVFVDWYKPWSGDWPAYNSFFSVSATASPATDFIDFGNTNGNSTNAVYWSAKTSNVSQLDYKQYNTTGQTKFKHAMALTTNDAAFAYAGAISGRTDDSITIPTVDRALIEPMSSHIKRITYWDTRLSDTILETITS